MFTTILQSSTLATTPRKFHLHITSHLKATRIAHMSSEFNFVIVAFLLQQTFCNNNNTKMLFFLIFLEDFIIVNSHVGPGLIGPALKYSTHLSGASSLAQGSIGSNWSCRLRAGSAGKSIIIRPEIFKLFYSLSYLRFLLRVFLI